MRARPGIKPVAAFLMALLLGLTGCGESAAPSVQETPAASAPVQAVEAMTEEPGNRKERVEGMIQLTIGENTVLARLAENEAAESLAALLQAGPIAMPASNYGGFEKVCSMDEALPRSDVQTTTQAGDIMLYNGNSIVVFYGTNSWAYTRLAWVVEKDIPKLESILSGSENEVILSLAREE